MPRGGAPGEGVPNSDKVLKYRFRLDQFARFGVGLARAGLQRVGGPTFRAFFSLPLPVSFFFPLSGDLLVFFCLTMGCFVEIGGVFEAVHPQMCTFGPLGCRLKPRWQSGGRQSGGWAKVGRA